MKNSNKLIVKKVATKKIANVEKDLLNINDIFDIDSLNLDNAILEEAKKESTKVKREKGTIVLLSSLYKFTENEKVKFESLEEEKKKKSFKSSIRGVIRKERVKIQNNLFVALKDKDQSKIKDSLNTFIEFAEIRLVEFKKDKFLFQENVLGNSSDQKSKDECNILIKVYNSFFKLSK